MKIKSNIIIQSKKVVDQIPGAWSADDHKNLLEIFGIQDQLSAADAEEMLLMAMSDEKPEDSATKLLEYRMSKVLTAGQIRVLSHEMQEDKVAEEYSDLFLQDELFNVNQLLYRAYLGRFPKCKAIVLRFELSVRPVHIMQNEDRQNEILLRALQPAMSGRSIIERLYDEELAGKKIFDDADGIIWSSEIRKRSEGLYDVSLWSSEYWLQDVHSLGEFEASFELLEEHEPKED